MNSVQQVHRYETPARSRQRRRKVLRTVLAGVILILVVATVGWCERTFLLGAIADCWIISDMSAPADAAVVLGGGGVEDRPIAAAAYYRAGLVKEILVSSAREGLAEKLGVTVPNADANRAILVKLGVPESAIETFGYDLNSTHDEALALRAWAQRTGAGSVVIPTEIFAARRVSWVFDKILGDRVVTRVTALDPPDYGRHDWWQHEQGLIAFQNEVIKYLYYRLKY